MNKADFFKLAMREGKYKDSQWVIESFAITPTVEEKEALKEPKYLYPVHLTTGYFFIDENNQLIKIDDAVDLDQPLLNYKDRLDIHKGEAWLNLKEDTLNTSYGNALMNMILLVHCFGEKVDYINTKFGIKTIEKLVVNRLYDTPGEGEKRELDKIYVDEWITFGKACTYILEFNFLAVPGETEKSFTTHPDMGKLKAELIEKYKDQLNDPAVIAEITKQLTDLDKEWLKDDESYGLLNYSGKTFDIVRKNLFAMIGNNPGLKGEKDAMPIISSIRDGMEIDRFPDYMDDLRAGSFGRGKETQLGGEQTKWLLRSTSNINILDKDCGTKIGIMTNLNENNIGRYLGFHYISDAGKAVQITKDNSNSLLGKTLQIRSTMFCKAEHTDYCKICAGPRLAQTPTATSSAIANIGSTIMLISMKAMHGKAVKTTKYNFLEELR